jgi:hypothetical protein
MSLWAQKVPANCSKNWCRFEQKKVVNLIDKSIKIIIIYSMSATPNNRRIEMPNQGKNQNIFDAIMGDCAGVDIITITPDDVKKQVMNLKNAGEQISDDELYNAIKGMYEYQNEQIVPMVEQIAREGCGIVFDNTGNGAGDPGILNPITIDEMIENGDFEKFYLELLDDDRRKRAFEYARSPQPDPDTTWYQIWGWVGDDTIMTAWIWRV